LSTLAGTPTSRSAAALMPLRLAHEAATSTNAFSNSRSPWAWLMSELRVDVEPLLDQLDLADRR